MNIMKKKNRQNHAEQSADWTLDFLCGCKFFVSLVDEETFKAPSTIKDVLELPSLPVWRNRLKPHLHEQFFLDKFTCQFLLLA